MIRRQSYSAIGQAANPLSLVWNVMVMQFRGLIKLRGSIIYTTRYVGSVMSKQALWGE